jgi:hypothetical protein
MSHPVVDTAITATLSDPDGMITGTTWQWSKSMTMDGTFMDIDGATMMSYTPVEGDGGYYLMATATYTDAYGSGMSAHVGEEGDNRPGNRGCGPAGDGRRQRPARYLRTGRGR